MKIWIVQGMHPTVPGCPIKAFSNERSANDEAVSLLRIIAKDMGYPYAVLRKNWQEVLKRLQADYHPAPDVWITELEVQD